MPITYFCHRCGDRKYTRVYINVIDTDASPNADDTNDNTTEQHEHRMRAEMSVCDDCLDPVLNLYHELGLMLPEEDKIRGRDVLLLDQLRNGLEWADPRCLDEGVDGPSVAAGACDEHTESA